LKAVIKRIPVLNSIAKYIYFTFVEPRSKFKGSELYWRKRYDAGLDSGEGSYLQLAKFKAKVINDFVLEHGIKSVLELGCGDGNQLTLANYPQYLGVDVSPDALERCRERFPGDDSKQFQLLDSELCPAESGLSRCYLPLGGRYRVRSTLEPVIRICNPFRYHLLIQHRRAGDSAGLTREAPEVYKLDRSRAIRMDTGEPYSKRVPLHWR
jgi:SAM-dependent methyltransferase